MSFLKKLAKGVTKVASKVTGLAAKIIPGPNPLLEGASAITGKLNDALNKKSSGSIQSAVAKTQSLVFGDVGKGAGTASSGASALQKASMAAFSDNGTTSLGPKDKKGLGAGFIAAIVGGIVVIVGIVIYLFTRKKRK